MKISRAGYARCPSCLSHVKVAEDRNCPFCGEKMAEADVIGEGAMGKLRSSRSALVAMGLAGGLTFAVACGETEPKEPTPNNTTNIEPNNITADYGGFDPDMGSGENIGNQPDMNEPDPNNITADYGGFDPGENIQPGPDTGNSGSDMG